MESNRSTKRKRIFDIGANSRRSYKRKFEVYQPVRFDSERTNCQSSRYSVSPLSTRRTTRINTSYVMPVPDSFDYTADKQTEDIRKFVKKIRTEQSISPLRERPVNIRHTWQLDPNSRRNEDTLTLFNSTSKPVLKQIVKQVIEEMELSSQRKSHSNEKRVTFELPGQISPKFQKPLKPILKTVPSEFQNPEQIGLPSSNTVRIIKQIRQQINEMFNLLRIH